MSVGRVDEPFPNISLSVFKILIKPVHAQPDLIGLRVHEDEGGLENRCGERFVAGAHRLPKVVHNVLCRNGTLDDETLGMFKGGISSTARARGHSQSGWTEPRMIGMSLLLKALPSAKDIFSNWSSNGLGQLPFLIRSKLEFLVWFSEKQNLIAHRR